jgi:GH18 family chitinase
MKSNGTSESYQKNNLKTIISFGKWLDDNNFNEITKKEQIITFLDTKIKNTEIDPDYLARIKFFIRWLYNH